MNKSPNALLKSIIAVVHGFCPWIYPLNADNKPPTKRSCLQFLNKSPVKQDFSRHKIHKFTSLSTLLSWSG